MSFNFFTFGGSLFWEDVFFYQKWRIQRHCFTKKYRLLDSWDIRRASGSFDVCQKAFIKYIECYEIPKQSNRMVILLHGYMDGKNIFKPLWRKLTLTNMAVAALNYPSLFRNSLSSAHQLLFFLNHMENIEELSFVTKGCGNLILRKTLNLPIEMQTFRNNTRIRNIVEVNPVLSGNIWCDLINKYRITRAIFGPMIYDMTENGVKSLPGIDSDIKCLVLFSKSITNIVFSKILKICKFPIKENNYKAKNIVYLKRHYLNVMKNEEVLNNTVKFINNGKI